MQRLVINPGRKSLLAKVGMVGHGVSVGDGALERGLSIKAAPDRGRRNVGTVTDRGANSPRMAAILFIP